MAERNSTKDMRSALKWAGGKKKLVNDIKGILPLKNKKRLIEPFVGGGSVFLNMHFEAYLLVDMNKDLINLFNIMKNDSSKFITEAEHYFKRGLDVAPNYINILNNFGNLKKDLNQKD